MKKFSVATMGRLSYVNMRQVCFALLFVFLVASCDKGDVSQPVGGDLTESTMALGLSSELELEDEAFKALVMTSKGSKPMVNLEKSSWNGHLFFRKKGATGVVAYVNLTWQVQRDARTNKIKLSYSGSPTFQNASALPALGETWYVAAVLGSGTLSADKQSIDFAAGAVQETPEGLAEGLDVPFASGWVPLKIERKNNVVERTAKFVFKPLGTIQRVEIKNTTNYDYRIYRNKYVNGRLEPSVPRIYYKHATADEMSKYLGLSLNFSNAKSPEASLAQGTLAIEPKVAPAFLEGNSDTEIDDKLGIVPNVKHPVTLAAKTGTFTAVFWNYIPKGVSSKLRFYGGLSYDMYTLTSHAAIRKFGSTSEDVAPAIEVVASNREGARALSYKLELFKRPPTPIDFLLTPEEERRYGVDAYIDKVALTPIEYNQYVESRYDILGQYRDISLWRTMGMSFIMPHPGDYRSTDTSGQPTFTLNGPVAEYPFGQDYTKTGPIIGDIIRGVKSDAAIYALRNLPVRSDGRESFIAGVSAHGRTRSNVTADNKFKYYVDGDHQMAMRYQYESGRLKITARYLGNASTKSINDIAKPSYWANDPQGLNIVYYLPETATYLKYGQRGGSFLGHNQNIRYAGSSAPSLQGKQIYVMTWHGFSEWGIWNERYSSVSYPASPGPRFYQELDERPFAAPHYINPHLLNKALK